MGERYDAQFAEDVLSARWSFHASWARQVSLADWPTLVGSCPRAQSVLVIRIYDARDQKLHEHSELLHQLTKAGRA